MIGLNFYFTNILLLFIYIYIEIFSDILFLSFFKNKKDNIINFSKKLNSVLYKNNIYNFCSLMILINLIFFKTGLIQNLILSIIYIYIFLIIIFSHSYKSNNAFLNFNIIFFLYFFLFIKTFISFFLFIELYSILFYFFF